LTPRSARAFFCFRSSSSACHRTVGAGAAWGSQRQRDHEGNTLAVSRLLTDGGGEYGGKADANHADAETAKVLNEFSKVCSLNAIQHTFT